MLNARTLVSTVDMPEEEWLSWRTRGIGGSDVAAICGLSPWKSPVQVFLEKTGRAVDTEENEAMKWGKRLEPVIADEFGRLTGFEVERVDAIMQHPEHDWALANVDRLIRDPRDERPGILEVKNTSAYLAKAWEEDVAPAYYICQLQWYLGVTGLKWGYFAPLIGGNRLLVDKRMEADAEYIEPLFLICKAFWKMVEERIPPAPDGSAASAELMKLMYPHAKKGKIIPLTSVSEEDVRTLERLKEELKEFERAKKYEIDAIANRIKAEMQDAEIGTLNGKPIASLKETIRSAYMVEGCSYRTLRILTPKTKE